MVPIIVAETVARDIDQGNARTEIGIGIDFVDKGMLSPVFNHQSYSHGQQRNQVDAYLGVEIDASDKAVQVEIVAELEDDRL